MKNGSKIFPSLASFRKEGLKGLYFKVRPSGARFRKIICLLNASVRYVNQPELSNFALFKHCFRPVANKCDATKRYVSFLYEYVSFLIWLQICGDIENVKIDAPFRLSCSSVLKFLNFRNFVTCSNSL